MRALSLCILLAAGCGSGGCDGERAKPPELPRQPPTVADAGAAALHPDAPEARVDQGHLDARRGTLDHLYKDARQIMQFATQLDVPVPGCAAAHEVIKSAIAHGWGEENCSALVKAMELQANVTAQARP